MALTHLARAVFTHALNLDRILAFGTLTVVFRCGLRFSTRRTGMVLP